MMNKFFHDYIPFASVPVFPAHRPETETRGNIETTGDCCKDITVVVARHSGISSISMIPQVYIWRRFVWPGTIHSSGIETIYNRFQLDHYIC